MIGYKFWRVREDSLHKYLLMSPFNKTLWCPGDWTGVEIGERMLARNFGFFNRKTKEYDLGVPDNLNEDWVCLLDNNNPPIVEVGLSAYATLEDLMEDDYVTEFPTILGVVGTQGKVILEKKNIFAEYMVPLAFFNVSWENMVVEDENCSHDLFDSDFDIGVHTKNYHNILSTLCDVYGAECHRRLEIPAS